MTGWGIYKMVSAEGARPADRNIFCGMFAYFLNDLAASFNGWWEYPVELIHHLIGLGVLGPSITANSKAVFEVAPKFMILETSTVILNLMWFLREFGMERSWLYRASSITFASLFFALRIAFLSYMMISQKFWNPELRQTMLRLGSMRYCLYAALFLQCECFSVFVSSCFLLLPLCTRV